MRFLALCGFILAFLIAAAPVQAQQWTADTAANYLTTTASVGIGTPTPGALLHVHNGPLKVSSDTQWSDLYIDAHTGNEARLSFQSANTPQWQIGKSGDNTRLFFYSYALGDAVMRLHDTGNVGIGVTNPTRLLDVGGSGALIRKDLITGGSEDGQNGRIFVRNSAGDNAIQLAASASNATYFNAGNVGIGTTTPEDILNIVTNTITDKISLTRNGHDQFYARADGVLGWGPATVQGILSWDTGESIIRAASGNALTFQTNGSTDRMIIDSSGNVGIGTNTPGYELDVAGTINATEILVDGQPLSATDSWDATNNNLHYTAGNVGIGTTSSSSKLTINESTTDPTNEVLTLTNHLGNANDAVSLRLNAGGGTSGTFLKHLRQGSSGGDFAIFTAPTLTGTSAERVRVTKDGDVGIGTDTPLGKLHVSGADSRTNPVIISSVSPGLYFYDTELLNDARRYDSFVLEADGNRFYIGSRDKSISDTPGTGVRHFTFHSEGRLGIGTTSPTNSRLYVKQGNDGLSATPASNTALTLESNTFTTLQFLAPTGSYNGFFFNEGTDVDGAQFRYLHNGNTSSSRYEFRGNASEWMRIQDGEVGIGVTNPTRLLDVGGSGALIRKDLITGGSEDGQNGRIFVRNSAGDHAIQLAASASNATYFNAGNVGIGTDQPDYSLDVTANNSADGFRIMQGTERFFAKADGTVRWNAGAGILSWDTGETIVRAGSARALTFQTNGSNADRLYINTNGDVGIGTTNPSSKLAVDGTITSKEVVVTVDQAAWPDYVFADDYTLRSLEEVEQFIDEKGHLPEVPSAEEVAEAGVAMGQMQATLLKKIEELTLYLIELKQTHSQELAQIQERRTREMQHLHEERAQDKATLDALRTRLEALEKSNN